ncbi:MAG: glycosyltransferase family 4 protein [Gemmatimonadetes bacterium]|nr:glycosyltransferase family 4 protein [Gemmatimonadota bacterium]
MEPVRIVMQCIYFPPEVGGLESHVYYLCRELVRLGHEVTMVTSRSLPGAAERETMDGVRVVRTWFPARNTAGWIAHTVASVPRFLAAARQADLLHAQTFASALPGMVASRRRPVPFVLTLHTSHFLRLATRPLWRPVLRRIVRSADWVLAASAEIRDVALGLYPHPRAEALTNGVDTDLFRSVSPALPPRAGGYRVIVPRRLFEKNGVEYLIRAVPHVRKRVDVETVIVGDGPLRQRLESLAVELGVAEHVRFLGARPNAEMPAILSSGDVVVIPSLMEATSVAALEAMSCGRPVAASRVGGLPEIIDEQVGVLFEPADPVSLADRLVGLLARPDREAMGERARARVVERWSLRRLALRHVEIYEQLVQERNAA